MKNFFMLKRRKQTELITGIDIGTSAVRVAVGQKLVTRDGHEDLQILGTTEVQSEGVHKGIISNLEECVSSLSGALEKTERLIGVPIEHAWIGVSGNHISSKENRGVVAVAKADGEISPDDVVRAVEAARAIATPLNYDILHVMPRSFSVDGQFGIKDPIGMTGIRLEAEAKIIYSLSSHLKNLEKTVYRTGLDIDDLVLSILAAGEAVITPRQKDLGVVVINIGAATTGMAVYEEGEIIHAAILPIGSAHITNDIALGLRTDIDVAEKVKLKYGNCLGKGLTKRDKIDLIDLGLPQNEEISLALLSEIIAARVAEILDRVNVELGAIKRSGLLPAGAVFTGGGAKIDGLVEFSKEELRLPASLGFPVGVSGVAENIGDLSFTTAIGLVKWGLGVQEGDIHGRGNRLLANTGKIMDKVKSIFKNLVP